MILWLIPVLILLYPSALIDPPPPPFEPPPAATAAAAPPPGPPGKAKLKLKTLKDIDRRAFLAAFERQADVQLIRCLRGGAGETGSLTFLARLSPTGRLTAVRIVEKRYSGLECARQAAAEMDFAAAAQPLKEDVEISWRFDW